jgi:hypothetical protein
MDLRMLAKGCQRKLMFLLFIVFIGRTGSHILRAEPRESRTKARHLEGRVLDRSTRKPVQEAQIRVLPSGQAVWRTDAQGRFMFWIPANIAVAIEIRQENYQTLSVKSRSEFLGDILLKPLPAGSIGNLTRGTELMPASQSLAPAIVTADSGQKVSGTGPHWSPWYRLGAGKAPRGYTVQKVEFWLTGDRACGAWAECRELARTDDRVLWEFRLQGHDEAGAPRRTFSTGHIRVTYRAQ